MKNKKFVLQLSLDENKELLDEIDTLIRERAKSIVREEAENLIGGSIREEARRVAKSKIDSMTNYEMSNVLRRAAVQEIQRNYSVTREIVEKEFISWLNDGQNLFIQQVVKSEVEKYVNSRLSLAVQPSVIKAVCEALVKTN